jgi:hypothetical protein
VILLLFKKNPKKATEYTEPEKMVLKIKTVDDIPVIKEMRKKIGNGEKREAIIYGYLNLKNDYSRYFGIPGYGSNRGFILGEIKEFDIIPGDNEPLTDNITIKNMIENFKYGEPDGKSKDIVPDAGKINETTRFFAIKKIALFYFNYYEIARFGDYNWQNLDEKEILDPVKDIYNYMDIMKLFYNGESSGN